VNLADRSVAHLKARRAYCLSTLADPATAEHRKPRIIAALDQLDACLRDRCELCHRHLTDPTSIANGRGDVCLHKGE
jgi:hypothetical protein